MKNTSLPSICFVAHNAYGSMVGREVGHIGGAERLASLFAKCLASRGYVVSVLTWDEGQPDGIKIDGVRLFKMCRRDAGIKGLRFLWPEWTSLITAMKRADADIYYQSCSECFTGQVALWCRGHGRKFIYSVVSDTECEAGLPRMNAFRERALYRYGLKAADRVIAQTRRQRDMLRTHYERDSVVIPMPCPDSIGIDYSQRSLKFENSSRILWVGRVCQVKRPDLLLELAKMCSDLQFDMIGPIGKDEYASKIVRDAQSIKNLTIHGRVTDRFLWDFYKKSSIFCSTSDIEGFPNTFLEAWSCGLPIVSTFDPDDLIAERGLGKVGKDVSELASGIRGLLDSPERWRDASQSARKYYLENHTLDKAMERFEQVFKEIAKIQ